MSNKELANAAIEYWRVTVFLDGEEFKTFGPGDNLSIGYPLPAVPADDPDFAVLDRQRVYFFRSHGKTFAAARKYLAYVSEWDKHQIMVELKSEDLVFLMQSKIGLDHSPQKGS